MISGRDPVHKLLSRLFPRSRLTSIETLTEVKNFLYFTEHKLAIPELYIVLTDIKWEYLLDVHLYSDFSKILKRKCNLNNIYLNITYTRYGYTIWVGKINGSFRYSVGYGDVVRVHQNGDKVAVRSGRWTFYCMFDLGLANTIYENNHLQELVPMAKWQGTQCTWNVCWTNGYRMDVRKNNFGWDLMKVLLEPMQNACLGSIDMNQGVCDAGL